MKKEDREFIAFLRDTLIPDLKQSGTEATAEDFERCVAIIEAQAEDLAELRARHDEFVRHHLKQMKYHAKLQAQRLRREAGRRNG